MRILITGAQGMLGSTLVSNFSCQKDFELFLTGQRPGHKTMPHPYLSFDLLGNDYSLLRDFCSPELIIHCAALTDIAHCERDPKLAWALNVLSGPKLARIFPNARIFYISSDAVYSPDISVANENSLTEPGSVYGRSKLAGERTLLEESGERALILRTTVVGFSAYPGKRLNFAHWLIGSLLAVKPVSLYKNVYFTPIAATDFASCLVKLWHMESLPQVLNLSGSSRCSRLDFGLALARELDLNINLVNASDSQNDPLRRQDQSLDSSRYEQYSGEATPNLKAMVRSLAQYWRKINERHADC